MKLAFAVGYKGFDFAGSQSQPNKRTVEGEFVAAGIGLGLFSDAKEAHFRISGRTDKGVSARRQIVSIITNHPERAINALNSWLPDDIWCFEVAEVSEDFYPRYAVTSRTYRYYFPYVADVMSMNVAARLFVGRHDFTRFSKIEKGRDPNRTVTDAKVFETSDGCPIFEVSANSFLWNMVRGMAGFLALVGAGVVDPEITGDLLATHGHRVHPAPPEALIFWDAECGVTFRPMRLARKTTMMLGRTSVIARAERNVAEVLMGEPPEMIWCRQLMREYPHLRN